MHEVSTDIWPYAGHCSRGTEPEGMAMNARRTRAITLSLIALAGIALALIAAFLFNGDTREAFLYLGSGVSSLSLVLLLQTVRPAHEMKRVAPPNEETDLFPLNHGDYFTN